MNIPLKTVPRFSDETLMAFADGELPAAEALRVRTAALTDAQLAARIAGFSATGRGLGAVFSDTLHEPVPDRLLQLLDGPATAVPTATVQPLRPRATAWVSRRAPLALAASLALVLGLGLMLRPAVDTPAPLAFAGLPADAARIAEVLNTIPSGEPVEVASADQRHELLPTATLRTADGRYCRAFSSTDLASGETLQARACRESDGRWAVQMAAAPAATDAGADASGFRPAGMAASDTDRPLSRADEQQLIERAWR